MRTVICAATATIFLGLGMALLLQATEASSEAHNATLEQTPPPSASLEATLEPTPTPSELQPILKAHYAIAAAPDDVSAVTMPIAYRQVRTVSIIEPTEAAPKNPGAPPAETSRTDYHAVEASPGAAVEEDRSAAAPNAKTTAATQDVTSPQQPSEERLFPSLQEGFSWAEALPQREAKGSGCYRATASCSDPGSSGTSFGLHCEQRNPVPLAGPAIQWRPIGSLRTRTREHTHSQEPSRRAGRDGAVLSTSRRSQRLTISAAGKTSLPIEAAGREGRRGGAFPEGAVARGGEGTAFDPALILTFFLALLWTRWGAQS